MSDLELQFARGDAEFAKELCNKLIFDARQENVAFSPFSIRSCLALAFAGAHGATADEIAEGLHFPSGADQLQIAQAYKNRLFHFQKSDQVKVANKIYFNEGSRLNSDYADRVKDYYYSEVESLDFAQSENAAGIVNDWVKRKTLGKISQLISADDLNEYTRLILLNALHFKGLWARKFDVEDTIEDDFWVTSTKAEKVSFMQTEDQFFYGELKDLDCSALQLPYKDSDLSMIVLLPKQRDGLKALGEKLSSFDLIQLTKRLYKTKVIVKLPKFKIDYSVELNNVLNELGIRKIFSDEADFRHMLEPSENVKVSKVLHKVVLEVNEEGTEAAAATAGIMMLRSCAPGMSPEPDRFEADHPFIYYITNAEHILFAGAFQKP